MKHLKDMNKAEYLRLFNSGMETADRYGSMCCQDAVVVLQAIINDGVMVSAEELEDAKDKIAGLESEVTTLNLLIDKLIAENTDLKHFLEEKCRAWK